MKRLMFSEVKWVTSFLQVGKSALHRHHFPRVSTHSFTSRVTKQGHGTSTRCSVFNTQLGNAEAALEPTAQPDFTLRMWRWVIKSGLKFSWEGRKLRFLRASLVTWVRILDQSVCVCVVNINICLQQSKIIQFVICFLLSILLP